MKGCWILDTLETKVLWDEAWNVSCGNAFSSISSSVGEGGGGGRDDVPCGRRSCRQVSPRVSELFWLL